MMPSPAHRPASLRDFTADSRILLLAAMAIVVGTGGAAAAWLLQRLITLATNLAYFGELSLAPWAIADNTLGFGAALVPVAGCLIIGLMARYGSEKIRGHGIPEAIEAILIGRSRVQARVAVLKPLSSAISIGTGGPFGAEGPIIMTGGSLGSLFAQLFHLSNAERKTLLVAGAAAGMSATFGTPIAAILLAVELLLFEWKPRSFVPVAVASIVAAAWRSWSLGTAPLFPLASSGSLTGTDLLLCVVLGIAAGLASGLLTALVYGMEDLFQRLPIHWMWWPAIGGVVIGVGGLIEPHALGVGYDNIAALLHGTLVGGPALRLLVVKAIIWSVALGSGTSGGVLAPLLIMGGVLGALFGGAVSPGETGPWALVGMAAMMGGTMRSPLTSMMFGMELTHDINALLPLAIGCAAAHTTTVLLLKRSILTEKIARRGHHVTREYVVDPFEIVKVADVMARPAEALPGNWTVAETLTFFTAPEAPRRHKSYPVTDADGRVLGMISRTDALRWLRETDLQDKTLREQVAGQDLVVGYDDELAGHLADRMTASDVGRVPILNRETGALVGLVARRDILRVRTNTVRHESERETLIRVLPRVASRSPADP
ncbi:MAG TPA: chloride channel protein [Steroidobacteraceae bacterium]|nr:chloride channel protein [Steroidobacteraceae bacterium]